MNKIILVDAWNTFVTSDGMFQEMKTLLDEYENQKIIVTNANAEQLVQFGIVNMPYEVFTLAHEPDKVDPNYFIKFMKQYSFEPHNLIYFEHNTDAVDSARSLGIVSYHYDKDARDLVQLKEFIDANL